jgi:hypothetical protein
MAAVNLFHKTGKAGEKDCDNVWGSKYNPFSILPADVINLIFM